MTKPKSTMPLSNIAEINPSVNLTGLQEADEVAFVPMADVTESGRWINRKTRPLKDVRVGYTGFQEGDVLFAKITPCMENGKGAHAIGLVNGFGFGSTEFHVLRAKGENSPRFIFHWLQSTEARSRAIAYMGGSAGQQRVQRIFFDKFEIPELASEEQVRAAEILDTLEGAIEKSEALIAKLKQVRAGMLHDLLTCGVDENGELRDPVRHPELFQESSLGKVPSDWKLVRIGDEADIEHGFAFSGQFFTNSPVGPRILVPGNFHRDGGLYFNDTNTKYYSAQFPKNTILPNGSILIVMTDLSPMTLILGRTVLLNNAFELLHNQRIGKFVLKKPEDWDSRFFVELMNDQRIRRRVILEATGTTVRHTSPERIKSGLALRPNRNEQSTIIKLVKGIDDEIHESVKSLAKITALRSGLRSDLLTGQVRIPPNLELI